MKKLWLIALLALGGCTTLQLATGSDVSPNAVYVAANTFDGAEAAATAYLKLPLCSANVSYACRTTAGVTAVVAAIRAGRTARNQLEAYVNANPGAVVPVSNYNALVTAVNTIQTYVATSGAKL